MGDSDDDKLLLAVNCSTVKEACASDEDDKFLLEVNSESLFIFHSILIYDQQFIFSK